MYHGSSSIRNRPRRGRQSRNQQIDNPAGLTHIWGRPCVGLCCVTCVSSTQHSALLLTRGFRCCRICVAVFCEPLKGIEASCWCVLCVLLFFRGDGEVRRRKGEREREGRPMEGEGGRVTLLFFSVRLLQVEFCTAVKTFSPATCVSLPRCLAFFMYLICFR